MQAGALLQLALALPDAGPVRLVLFDAAGRRVSSVDEVPAAPARVTVSWRVPEVAPGLYVLRVTQAGESVRTPILVSP